MIGLCRPTQCLALQSGNTIIRPQRFKPSYPQKGRLMQTDRCHMNTLMLLECPRLCFCKIVGCLDYIWIYNLN